MKSVSWTFFSCFRPEDMKELARPIYEVSDHLRLGHLKN